MKKLARLGFEYYFIFPVGMDSESSCTKTHYYQAGDVFKASVKGRVYNGRCPLTFIQDSSRNGGYREPCLSLCVELISYTLDANRCPIRMSYYDGPDDFAPLVRKLYKIC